MSRLDKPDRDRTATLRSALDLIAAVGDAHVREVLARATVNLAGLRLDLATIDTTWEDSAMPIPSLTQRIHDEALREGRDEGLREGRNEIAVAILRRRFGDDARIPAVAQRLASLEPDDVLARIEAATSLDQLDPPDR